MKANITLAALLLLVVGLSGLTSCSHTGEGAQTTFNSYSASSTYSLIGSAADFDRPTDVICNDSVSLMMPITLNGRDVQQLRNTIMKRALGVSPTSIENAMNEWLTANAAQQGYKTEPSNAPASQADGFNHVSGYIVNLTPNTLVYCIATDTFNPGAANGFATLDYINYSMTDGTILTLKDIFTDQGLAQLPAVIAEQAANNTLYAGQVDITALPEAENFYLSSEGEIVFSYYPTEVAPHYLGSIQVPFYPYELVGYMTPKAIKLFHLEDL